MTQKLTGIALSLLVLIPWTIFIDSHYQKGGVDYSYYWVGIIATLSNFVYLIPQRTKMFNKLFLTLGVGGILIVLQNFFLTPSFIRVLYSDKTWFLWETQPRLIVNSFHYFLELFAFITICELLLRKKLLTT